MMSAAGQAERLSAGRVASKAGRVVDGNAALAFQGRSWAGWNMNPARGLYTLGDHAASRYRSIPG
jgi:hypothetical protein